MKRVLVVVLVVVLALLAFIATRPGEYRVERSATIQAPADSVYARLVDFHRWDAWSPWAKLDPAMKVDYSGTESGVGAIYHWTGNDKVGEGRMTVTEAETPSRVGIHLEFLKPFASVSTTTFALSPEGEGTRVVWAMEGKNDFVSKAMGIVMPMDKMIGGDFEKGLAQLKQQSEAAAAAPAPTDSTAAEAASH